MSSGESAGLRPSELPGPDGQAVLWAALRQKAEALARFEGIWYRVFENSAIGIALTDLSGRFLSTNAAYQAIVGYSDEELRGLTFLELTHEDDRRQNQKLATELMAGKKPQFQIEKRYRRKDGRIIWVSNNVSLVLGDPNSQGCMMAIVEDITERKRVELELQELKDQLLRENVVLREEVDATSMFEEIVGNSPALRVVLARVAKVALTDSTVLITGETGTGKELIARAIHKRSARSAKAFVSLNCAAIPPSLIASELFGHEKGAFTGALQQRLGRFELAQGGTLFLDEIGELPMELQVNLLRVLQEREFERVGGSRPIRSDVRLIAATNRDLKSEITSGKFRKDLFYRLNVFPIEMPSLRARREDIPLLAEYFIHRYAKKLGKKVSRISKKTLQMFQDYEWPGNIRELQNVVERSLIVCETQTFSVDESWLAREPIELGATQPLSTRLATDERAMIEAALAESRGRVSGPRGAASRLGMPPSTLESRIRVLKINKHRFKYADNGD